jgi:hypothetical protein
MNKAPWPDFAGNDIHEGDIIRHPDGGEGTVVFLHEESEPSDRWRVNYPLAGMGRLSLQIGDKGQAVVVPSCKCSLKEMNTLHGMSLPIICSNFRASKYATDGSCICHHWKECHPTATA